MLILAESIHIIYRHGRVKLGTAAPYPEYPNPVDEDQSLQFILKIRVGVMLGLSSLFPLVLTDDWQQLHVSTAAVRICSRTRDRLDIARSLADLYNIAAPFRDAKAVIQPARTFKATLHTILSKETEKM